ncbi:MAG: hypothetical protein H2212_19075 [Ruminococcus sp.]|nr:hypothetical protein [Ruminococcus sp.]
MTKVKEEWDNRQETVEVLKYLNENYFTDGFNDANVALEIAIQELEN